MKKACPHCNTVWDLADELQGTDVQCTRCRRSFAVPILLTPIGPAPNGTGLRHAVAWKIAAAVAGGLVILWLLMAWMGGDSDQKKPVAQAPRAASTDSSASAIPPPSPSPTPRTSPATTPHPSPAPSLPRSDTRPSPRAAADADHGRQSPGSGSRQAAPDIAEAPVAGTSNRAGPFAPSDRSLWKEGFEDGLGSFWKLVYLHPEQPHGKGYVTNQHVHSGRNAFALEQAPGQHCTALEHEFREGFRGRLSVWMLLVDRELPPGARRDAREGSHTCFKVQETDSLEFQIGHGIKSGRVEVASRCIERGKFDRTTPGPSLPGDWHQYAIEVQPDGTRGFVDGEPLQSHHPSLTLCRKVRLEIGWSCGGIVVCDDFEATP